MSPSLQLGFSLRTSPNCKSVHLLGSWDGYQGQLPMSKDSGRSGSWKGTFKFQGSTLRSGQRYWYYVRAQCAVFADVLLTSCKSTSWMAITSPMTQRAPQLSSRRPVANSTSLMFPGQPRPNRQAVLLHQGIRQVIHPIIPRVDTYRHPPTRQRHEALVAPAYKFIREMSPKVEHSPLQTSNPHSHTSPMRLAA